MTNESDINIEHWFIDHCLPWSQATATNLYDARIECVEDLKLYPADVFYELFQSKSSL